MCVCVYIYIYIYIYSHPQTFLLYLNSLVWPDMQDGTSWNQNPADFTSVRYLTPQLASQHK